MNGRCLMPEKNWPWLSGWYERAAELAIAEIQKGLPESAAEHLQWTLDNAEKFMNENAPEVSRARIEKT